MISIVITGYKEGKTITKAIESALANNLQEKYEILVVSPDEETLNEAKKFSKKNKEVKTLKDEGKGKPSALNLVFQKAKGDILILTDGDVYMENNALSNLLSPFNNPSIGAVSGRPVSLNPKSSLLGFWSHLLTDIADLRRKDAVSKGRKFYCSGYLYAIRRGIVKEIPPETLSDDGFISHLIYLNKYQLAYSSESKVYVKFPTTFKDWVKQKKRSAGGYTQIKRWTNKEMRSFTKESLGLIQVLKYPSSFKEFFYTLGLIFARVYLWLLILKDIRILNKDFKKVWTRVESTKN
jgi:cellulose synthase/poly-beta-1,6-N-acetylglucosamine synthase-like glycosyltransferase